MHVIQMAKIFGVLTYFAFRFFATLKNKGLKAYNIH